MKSALVVVGILAMGIAATVPAGEGTAVGHQLLLVEMEGEALRVVRVDRVDQPLPRRRGPEKALPWRFRVETAKGEVVHAGRFEDPTLVRGEFHAKDGSGRIEAVRVERTGKVYFSLRVPAAGAERVVVQKLKAGTPRQRVSTDRSLLPTPSSRHAASSSCPASAVARNRYAVALPVRRTASSRD